MAAIFQEMNIVISNLIRFTRQVWHTTDISFWGPKHNDSVLMTLQGHLKPWRSFKRYMNEKLRSFFIPNFNNIILKRRTQSVFDLMSSEATMTLCTGVFSVIFEVLTVNFVFSTISLIFTTFSRQIWHIYLLIIVCRCFDINLVFFFT